MTFYITKYATTKGIIKVDTDQLKDYKVTDGTKLYVNFRDGTMLFINGGEWYTSKNMAIADAEHRRAKKIESLKRQIEKLKALNFDI